MSDLSSALDPIILRVRVDATWKKDKRGTVCQAGVPITPKRIQQHLNGGPALGVCPIKEGESTVELAVLDLDSHKGETPWEEMQKQTGRVVEALELAGCAPYAFRSSGGNGVHIYIIWNTPQDAYSVREFIRVVLISIGYGIGTRGVAAKEIEVFPKQNNVPLGGFGNQFILPLNNKSVPLDPIFFDALPREDVLTIPWAGSINVPAIQLPEPKSLAPKQVYDGDLTQLNKMLETIPNEETNYDRWIQIGMAIHAETEGSHEGLELWETWSSKCPEYSGYEQLEYKWNSFRGDKPSLVTAASIKRIAEENGYRDDDAKDFEDVSDPVEDQEDKRERYVPIRADQFIERAPIKWHIKGIWPEGQTMAYGASTAGKTFVMLDIACHIAMGTDWNEHKTKRGHVLYICAEGAGGMSSRIRAWALHHDVDPKELGEYLTIIADSPNLLDKKDIAHLTSQIKKYLPATDIFILDTFAQATAGADENSAKDMGMALKSAHGILRALDSSYCLVHHSGKNEDKGARGSSNLKPHMDAMFYISREENSHKFWVDKMKDGVDNFGFDFTLDTQNTDRKDEDGEAIMSCVVTWGDKTSTKKKNGAHKKYGPWETAVLSVIDGFELEGKEVTVESILIEVCATTAQDPQKRDQRRSHVKRAIDSLKSKGAFEIRANKIITNLESA